MSKKFFYFYFILIIILIFISNINLSQLSNLNQEIIPETKKEFSPSEFHYNKNSLFSWPVFGYYSISSFFGKRKSPTTRRFYIPFWNRYSCNSWYKYLLN